MEVEDVARKRLATRRAAQQQRELAVGVRVLREVVVDDQRVLPVVEEVLAHRAPANGAIHLIGAASCAAAVTMIVYSIAPSSLRRSYTCATVEPFWPIAT